MDSKKIIFIVVIMTIISCFFIFDLHHYINLENLKSQQLRFKSLNEQYPILTKLGYFLIYLIMAALSLPGALILTLAGGVLFGVFTGSILASFASTIGATMAMLAARYLFRESIQDNYADKLKVINDGIEKEGGFYLFTLRLIPIVPFFIVNILMGLTPIKTSVFTFISQLGMLPATVIYVNAGHQLASIDSLNEIISIPILLSLAALGLFPLIAKKFINYYKSHYAQ